MIDKIIEAFEDESFLKVDGFDKAIIGVDEFSLRLVYSVSKCIDILCEEYVRRRCDRVFFIQY